MKYLYKTIIIIAISTLFTACGGGGGGGTIEGGSSEATKISVVICGGVGTPDECWIGSNPYTCVKNGDTLVAETDDTELEVVHSSDDDKRVCVVQGSAHILRN